MPRCGATFDENSPPYSSRPRGKGGIGSIVVAAISFFFVSFFFLWRPVEAVEILTRTAAAGCSKLSWGTHGSVTNIVPDPHQDCRESFEPRRRQETERILRCCPARTRL